MSREHRMSVIALNKYHGVAACGQRGFGKSGFVEWAAEQFAKKGRLMLDLFDAGDFENCFWTIPKDTQYKILLVHPHYVTLKRGRQKFDILPMCDKDGFQNICETAIDEERVVSFGCGFYEEDHLYTVLAEWINQFPKLTRDILKMDSCVLIREASHMIFSHLRTSENQTFTRKAVLRLIRIARHYRTSFVMDAQRIMDIYAGIRENLDRTIIKRIPIQSLPKLLYWVAKEIDESWSLRGYPHIFDLEPHQYWCVTEGSLSFGTNPLPSFHHKKPKDDFFDMTGVRVEYDGHELEEMDLKSALTKPQLYQLEYLRRTLGFVVEQIYQKRLSIDGKKYSISKLAKMGGISPETLSKLRNTEKNTS
jgi:hypothetical protein